MVYREYSVVRILKMRCEILTIIVAILLSVKSYSQNTIENHLVTSGVKKHNGVSINQLTDSIINVNKREALDSGNDSLYIALIFQQFDKKNINSVDVFGVVLLNDLIINKIDISDKYLDVLLRAYLSLGNYFMNQENSFASETGLIKYYFEKYSSILRVVKLNPRELEQFRIHRLDYLTKTNNDSLFYYIDKYSIPKEKENLILTKWHRLNKNHPRELFYASQTSDLLEQMIAFGNNNKIKKADSLYSVLMTKHKPENPEKENVLHQKMAHILLNHSELAKAEKLYEKSLAYFEQHDKLYQFEESLISLGISKCEASTTPHEMSQYSERVRVFNKKKVSQQLSVLTNHLSLISKVSNWNTKKKLTEKTKIEEQLNIQKTVISLGFGFLIVLAVFTFIYCQRVKERNELKLANNIMKINIIKSKFKPHFTFNVLSVVNYFIAKKDFENASTSLNKMAGLLRITLDNINKELVSYESEYKICEYYMYLEGLRFSEKFDFQIEPLTEFKTKKWQLPAGIIEPFLENSVNQSFNNTHKKGLITMGQQIKNKCLVITIRDNGSSIDENVMSERYSHGLSISQDIISATSRMYGKKIKLEIKTESGTEIIIAIPLLKPA